MNTPSTPRTRQRRKPKDPSSATVVLHLVRNGNIPGDDGDGVKEGQVESHNKHDNEGDANSSLASSDSSTASSTSQQQQLLPRVLYVVGSSTALDGLEDKDEMVRSLQRCKCNFVSPPSVLLSWDATRDECVNVVGKDLPRLSSATSSSSTAEEDDVDYSRKPFAVLKEPMGTQGQGIFFVSTAEEIHTTIQQHYQKAVDAPDFLDSLIASKGRIPSWGAYILCSVAAVCLFVGGRSAGAATRAAGGEGIVSCMSSHLLSLLISCTIVLQAEVQPSLLIRDQRKFHLRSYVVVMEQPEREELVEVFVCRRHEVIVAGKATDATAAETRDPAAHITNASSNSERLLLEQIPELVERNHQLQGKLERFLADTFGRRLLPDMARRVHYYGGTVSTAAIPSDITLRKFTLAGLDLMVTADYRIFLLEVNVNPVAPCKGDEPSIILREHTQSLLRDLAHLAVGNPTEHFVSASSILETSNE